MEGMTQEVWTLRKQAAILKMRLAESQAKELAAIYGAANKESVALGDEWVDPALASQVPAK